MKTKHQKDQGKSWEVQYKVKFNPHIKVWRWNKPDTNQNVFSQQDLTCMIKPTKDIFQSLVEKC